MDELFRDTTRAGVHAPPAAPLPRNLTHDQLLALRKLKEKRSLNDLVEDIFVLLILDPAESGKFTAFLEATDNAEAIEGSTAADNLEAARMVRERAKSTNSSELAEKKLAVIAHALNIVAKRYGYGRKQRKYTVSGEYVAPEPNNNHDSAE